MIGLSQSTLSLFQECARCFWLAKIKKLDRPRSPMAGVVNAIDAMMKQVTENAFAKGLPVPYLEGLVDQPYPKRAFVQMCRSWQTFQVEIEIGGQPVKAWGELDDLLVDADGKVSPWDYKSKDREPPDGYSEKWYQLQADMYHLLLEGQDLKCTGFAYFTYAWPVILESGMVTFEHATYQVRTDPKRALETLGAAAKCLVGKMPASAIDCKVCQYIDTRTDIILSLTKTPKGAHA